MTNIPSDERCSTSGTNQLDTDLSAYKEFIGQDYYSFSVGIFDLCTIGFA